MTGRASNMQSQLAVAINPVPMSTRIEYQRIYTYGSSFFITSFSCWLYWFLVSVRRVINNIGQCFALCFCKTEAISATWKKLQFQFKNKWWVCSHLVMTFLDNNKVIKTKGCCFLWTSSDICSKYNLYIFWISNCSQKMIEWHSY